MSTSVTYLRVIDYLNAVANNANNSIDGSP
ncbi:MAG: hypothetical protein QOJ65_977, partial [Fimbriimonadaceae bacterium]|nr:hypothetical protein [Fimbriimonadaceae bacterium]